MGTDIHLYSEARSSADERWFLLTPRMARRAAGLSKKLGTPHAVEAAMALLVAHHDPREVVMTDDDQWEIGRPYDLFAALTGVRKSHRSRLAYDGPMLCADRGLPPDATSALWARVESMGDAVHSTTWASVAELAVERALLLRIYDHFVIEVLDRLLALPFETRLVFYFDS